MVENQNGMWSCVTSSSPLQSMRKERKPMKVSSPLFFVQSKPIITSSEPEGSKEEKKKKKRKRTKKEKKQKGKSKKQKIMVLNFVCFEEKEKKEIQRENKKDTEICEVK